MENEFELNEFRGFESLDDGTEYLRRSAQVEQENGTFGVHSRTYAYHVLETGKNLNLIYQGEDLGKDIRELERLTREFVSNISLRDIREYILDIQEDGVFEFFHGKHGENMVTVPSIIALPICKIEANSRLFF